jgi:hypothetical protein
LTNSSMTRKLYGRLETQYKLSTSGIDINLTIYQKKPFTPQDELFSFFFSESVCFCLISTEKLNRMTKLFLIYYNPVAFFYVLLSDDRNYQRDKIFKKTSVSLYKWMFSKNWEGYIRMLNSAKFMLEDMCIKAWENVRARQATIITISSRLRESSDSFVFDIYIYFEWFKNHKQWLNYQKTLQKKLKEHKYASTYPSFQSLHYELIFINRTTSIK